MIEIPGYTVLRLLGHGGMATVYLAQQQSLRREVALKILSPALAQDAVATERFLREARISAKLHHPHIVAIYDVGLHDGVPYMSIAYEPGGTVAQKVQGHGDLKFALRIVRDIAGALDYAHHQGVIHRDVKPENILLRNDGSCVLSDFGIAHAVEAAQTGLTREGTSVGTPHYMSPEQLRGEHVDGRSDIYSLGVVFFQLLTGDLPYQGTDGWAIGMQHISAPIPRLPLSVSHLQTFLDVLLAKDPAARLQTGAEVMQWAEARLSGQTPAMTVALPTPHPGPHTSGTRHALASLAILPFADMSQGKDQEYLADGLSEELLNLLSKTPQLHVAGRSSAFSFKGKNAKLVDIGRELKVATVLEGSVRKFGERVRISVQLINVADGFQMWSETYDRQLTDVFQVQDEIAALVAAALKAQLLPKEPAAPDPDLAKQLQLGRKHLHGAGRDDALAAIAAFAKVLALDANNSEARAGSSEAQQTLALLDAAEAELKAHEAKEEAAAAEREAQQKSAAQAREREAAEKAAAQARERVLAEKAAAQAQEQQAAEEAAAQARQRQAAEHAAALEREAAEKSAAQARDREAAERAADEARRREAAEAAAAQARRREALEQAQAEARQREAAEQARRQATAEPPPPTIMAPAVAPAPPEPAPAIDPAAAFASAYASTSKSKSKGTAPPAEKPVRRDSEPSRKNFPVIPLVIVGTVLALGLAAWQLSAYFNRQHQEQCQALLAQSQSAIDANDFDKAASSSKQAEGVCTGDGSTRLQALAVVIQAGKAQAQICESTETQAKDLLDKGLPAQAGELLFKAHADCSTQPGFSQLVKQPAAAQSEARSLVVRASSLVSANAVDDAQKLIDQALALDSSVPDAQELLQKLAAKRAKLPAPPAVKPVPAIAETTPARIEKAPKPAPTPATTHRVEPPISSPPPPAPRAPAPVAVAPTPAPQPVPQPVLPAPTPPPAPRPEPPRNELIPISTPHPEYPVEARRTGVEGEVTVSFTVNTDGSVSNVKIIRAKPLATFNLQVQTAVRHWRFQPLDQPQTVTRVIGFKLSD